MLINKDRKQIQKGEDVETQRDTEIFISTSKRHVARNNDRLNSKKRVIPRQGFLVRML